MDKKDILIVDDEPDTLLILGKAIAARGYSVATAKNGSDAILLAKSVHPSIIILDILMPDMDGAEVAARLKEDSQTKDIPVIFLTCLITRKEEGSGKRYHDAEGHLFVAKPYDMEELISHIAALITKPALVKNSI